MKIEKEIYDFLARELDAISNYELPTHSHSCPHCGIPVRYPTVAREHDIEDFRLIMESAYRVMEEIGVMDSLFSSIHAKIAIALVQRRARAE